MADGEKVTEGYLSESSDDESDDELGPSYVKLVSLAGKQQRALENVQTCLVSVMICWVKKWISQKLWLKVFRDFILSMTPFKVIITLV